MLKINIDAFFLSFDLQKMHTRFKNFYNIKILQAQIHCILYDIKNNHWTVDKFIVIIDINDFTITKYIIYYRDVFQMIRFFLDHKSFQKKLNYISVRIKTINNNDVYNKIYIKNWW